MKAVTWKTVFAAMNPSPVFEAVAEFAEVMADQRRSASFKQTDNVQSLSLAEAGTANGRSAVKEKPAARVEI
jgi:hypothetical protein